MHFNDFAQDGHDLSKLEAIGTVIAGRTLKGRNTSELDVTRDELLEVLALHQCPKGMWLLRNAKVCFT